jgi:hypothetical protein
VVARFSVSQNFSGPRYFEVSCVRRFCGMYFKASVVIMTLSHDFGVLLTQDRGDR